MSNETNIIVNNGQKQPLNSTAGDRFILVVFGLLLLAHVVWPGFIEAVTR